MHYQAYNVIAHKRLQNLRHACDHPGRASLLNPIETHATFQLLLVEGTALARVGCSASIAALTSLAAGKEARISKCVR